MIDIQETVSRSSLGNIEVGVKQVGLGPCSRGSFLQILEKALF